MDSIQISGLIINALIMLVAIRSSRISFLVYKENSSPDIIVYLEQNKDAKSIINLVIKNIGKKPATNITFDVDKKLPQTAYSGQSSSEMTIGALIDGIPYLAPGAARISIQGDFHGLNEWLKKDVITVKATFYKANCISFFKRAIVSTSFIEIHSFSMNSAADNSSGYKIFKELKNINQSIARLNK